MTMKIIARHRWVAGATITESYDTENDTHRRFTATIDGYQNFKIYDGSLIPDISRKVISQVEAIRERIRNGDENVFHENTLLEM